ncbi:hypothetical protein V6N13_076795 [Hibiscus sabdariffa]
MENPNGELNPSLTPADGVRFSMATGGLILDNKCGKPSESIISMEDCSILERPGSPVAVELQPASKKGRTFEDSMEVLMQTETLTADGRGRGQDSNASNDVQERVLSFKDMLFGGIDRNQEELLVEDLDVEEVCGVQGNRVAEDVSQPIQRDPNYLYGPWMQVVNKRRRNLTNAVGEVERAPVARSAKGRVLPLSIKGGTPLGSVKKGVELPTTQKMNLKPKKTDDRVTSKATLAASLSPLIAELDSSMNDGSEERGEGADMSQPQIMAELPPNGDAGPDIADWRLEDRQTGQGSLRFFVGFYGRIAVAALWGLNVSTARSCWSEIFMGHALVIEIKGLMRRGCDLSVKHILRECNACADRMAALGRGREATSMEYEDPPVELLDLIREEASSFFDQS